jgi:hypothetical protein
MKAPTKPTGRVPDEDDEFHSLVAAAVAEYKQQLTDALLKEVPQELMPHIGKWLSENYSFMTTRGPLEAWIMTWALGIQTGSASHIVQCLFTCMQSGMRLSATEKGQLGWVHCKAQVGDRIARVFGCSQFIVLRASRGGDHFQVIGDALLSGLKVEDLGPWGDDEVKRLKIQ